MIGQTELTVVTCLTCGCVHAIPETLRAGLERNGGWYKCPNGHSQGWGDNEAKRLARKLAAEEARREQAEARARRLSDENDHLVASRNALKGHLTRHKKRTKNGVCPCCHRSFENLRRHMATKHPGFAAESGGDS